MTEWSAFWLVAFIIFQTLVLITILRTLQEIAKALKKVK